MRDVRQFLASCPWPCIRAVSGTRPQSVLAGPCPRGPARAYVQLRRSARGDWRVARAGVERRPPTTERRDGGRHQILKVRIRPGRLPESPSWHASAPLPPARGAADAADAATTRPRTARLPGGARRSGSGRPGRVVGLTRRGDRRGHRRPRRHQRARRPAGPSRAREERHRHAGQGSRPGRSSIGLSLTECRFLRNRLPAGVRHLGAQRSSDRSGCLGGTVCADLRQFRKISRTRKC